MSTKKNSDNNEKKQANNPRKSIFEGTRVAFVLNTPVNSRWVMFKVKFSSFYLDSPFLDVFRARCQGWMSRFFNADENLSSPFFSFSLSLSLSLSLFFKSGLTRFFVVVGSHVRFIGFHCGPLFHCVLPGFARRHRVTFSVSSIEFLQDCFPRICLAMTALWNRIWLCFYRIGVFSSTRFYWLNSVYSVLLVRWGFTGLCCLLVCLSFHLPRFNAYYHRFTGPYLALLTLNRFYKAWLRFYWASSG